MDMKRRLFKGFPAWRSERGVTVPVVMAAMVVLTALAIGAWTASSQNFFMSDRDKYEAQALNIAEAGLEAAVWQLKTKGNEMTFPATLTYTHPQGTATVTIEEQGWNDYEVVSRGVTTNGKSARWVKTHVFYLSLWNFLMGAGSLTAGGGGVNGTTSVKGPFYVRGNLRLSGNSEIMDGPLFVRNGDLNLTGSSRVGDASTPTRVPCYIDGSHPPLNDPDFYATLSTNVPDLSLPPLRDNEMQGYYNTASYQSRDMVLGDTSSTAAEDNDGWPSVGNWVVPWAGSPGYKVVDNDAAPGSLGEGSYGGLTFSSALAAFGRVADQDFAWDPSTNPMTLVVRGTVFVDGPVTFTGDINQVGNGTIVANGRITIDDGLKGAGYPSQNVLGLVTPTEIVINTNDSHSDEENPALNGAYFATQRIAFNGNQAYIRGSLLSGNLTFAHPNIHIVTDPQLPSFLPKAMPGSTQMLTFPTHWQEGR